MFYNKLPSVTRRWSKKIDEDSTTTTNKTEEKKKKKAKAFSNYGNHFLFEFSTETILWVFKKEMNTERNMQFPLHEGKQTINLASQTKLHHRLEQCFPDEADHYISCGDKKIRLPEGLYSVGPRWSPEFCCFLSLPDNSDD